MGHGLRFSVDIDGWHHWQERRSLLRRVRNRLGPAARAGSELFGVVRGGPDADICVVVDATHASVAAALLEPLAKLPRERTVLVLAPGLSLGLDHPAVPTSPEQLASALRGVTTVLGSGHYTSAGAAVWAVLPGARTFVSQHGALTPFAPPLPDRTTVLAWTQADGDFWRSGRDEIGVESVGSQLLWQAGLDSAGPTRASRGGLTYLGQGHAAEIPRARMVGAALHFCREHGATYRPHPSERDRLSLMTLGAYQRAGITVSTGAGPLSGVIDPIVSVFSTGVLEAAARGRDAWVDFPRPPSWLGEFWERYGMSRFGTAPTPAPARPEVEPARRIAEIVMKAAG
jgi:hypothetical protein